MPAPNEQHSQPTHEHFPMSRILIVDDELLIRWSLRESLTEAGHEVFEAEDGKTASPYLSTVPPFELVLLDLRLPDTTGLALLKQFKLAQQGCQVILMTAYGSPEVTDEAMREGVFRVVTKPFNLEDMLRLVNQALDEARVH